MHHRDKDGVLSPRDHLQRLPLVIDPNDESEVARLFNSGGAGMFAKPQEYARELCHTRYLQNPGDDWLTTVTRGPGRAAEQRHLPPDQRPTPAQGDG